MSRVPRLLPAASARSLNLTPPEASLLSLVDAVLDEDALALVAGMAPDEVGALLDRLAMLGAIEIVEARERTPSAPPRGGRAGGAASRPPDGGPAPAAGARPQVPSPSPSRPGGAGSPAYDPRELDEKVDLELDKKRRVLDLYYRLDDLTYYALLGVGAEAEKKQIKSAYYVVGPEFHPDKFFRKNLGSFKHKIEAIFARTTLAHDVLTVPERRAEYDGYLRQTHKNRAVSAALDESPPDVAAVLAAVEQAAARAVAEIHRSVPPPSAPVGAPPGASRSAPPAPPRSASSGSFAAQAPPARPASSSYSLTAQPQPVRPPSVSSLAAQAPPAPARAASGAPAPAQDEVLRLRREALARKLVGGAPRRPGPSSGTMPAVRADQHGGYPRTADQHGGYPRTADQHGGYPRTPGQEGGSRPPPPPASAPRMDPVQIERATEALRMRHEAAVAEAKRVQLDCYLDAGKGALAREDYAGAANAYRIAASLAPDDPAVQATCNDALRRAAAALSDGYWKQANYEESQQRWSEAALSYSKVCTGRPDSAPAHERVAFATLKSGGNARRAVDFARKAVEIDPRKPDYHVTLARAYAGAGLEKSAGGELDRALELAPKDPKVQAMVASARSALSQKEAK